MSIPFFNKSGNQAIARQVGSEADVHSAWAILTVVKDCSECQRSFPARSSWKSETPVFHLLLLPFFFFHSFLFAPQLPPSSYLESTLMCPISIYCLKHCLITQISTFLPFSSLHVTDCLFWWSVECNGLLSGKKKCTHAHNFAFNLREFSGFLKPDPFIPILELFLFSAFLPLSNHGGNQSENLNFTLKRIVQPRFLTKQSLRLSLNSHTWLERVILGKVWERGEGCITKSANLKGRVGAHNCLG